MKEVLGYFVCDNGAIWTVFNDYSSNYNGRIQVSNDGGSVEVLGEQDGKPGCDTVRIIEGEYSLWQNLVDLAAHIEAHVGGASLEELRSDLTHQLSIPDEIDWSYFLDTASRALVQADRTARNMKFGVEAKISYHNRPYEFGCHYSALLPLTVRPEQ